MTRYDVQRFDREGSHEWAVWDDTEGEIMFRTGSRRYAFRCMYALNLLERAANDVRFMDACDAEDVRDGAA